ncbi:hypothetical protein L6R50_22330 [Myxococcota bacterium]|nr:hypothetical protein [Myxococcota bacterium]
MARDTLVNERGPFENYATPLSGLSVSWGAILAGATATLGAALVIWALTLAITLSATEPTVDSLQGAIVALVVTGIISILIGAAVGGAVSVYLTGHPSRKLGAAHAFTAWAVAFLVYSVVSWSMVGNLAGRLTQVTVATTTAAVQTAGGVVGGVAAGPAALDQRAINLLTALGYPPEQAQAMVADAQTAIQNVLRGRTAVVPEGAPEDIAVQARGALDAVIDWAAGLSWMWFGTWFLAGGIAVGVGIAVASRIRKDLSHRPEIAPIAPPPEVPRAYPTQPPPPSV